MVIEFALLADSVMTRPDGKLDLHGVGFNTIYARSVPATHPRLVVALRFRLSVEEATEAHRFTVGIRDIHGKQIAAAQGEQPPADPSGLRPFAPEAGIGLGYILNFEGLVFEDYGWYELAVTWDGEPVHRLPILVAEPPAPSS